MANPGKKMKEKDNNVHLYCQKNIILDSQETTKTKMYLREYNTFMHCYFYAEKPQKP